MCNILFVGGGSVGHIAPSVAVARSLASLRPDVHPRFICSARVGDRTYLDQEGLQAIVLHAPRLGFQFLWRFPRALVAAHTILEKEQPSAIFSTGGYVSVPVCLAAGRWGIPIILHKPDAGGGLATWLVGKLAQIITTGFPAEHPAPKERFTGNPLRPMVLQGNREQGLRITGLQGNKPVLLVIGGSLGAQALNEAVARHLDTLLSHCDIIHLTGEGKSVIKGTRAGYWSASFVVEELPHLYATADLALSRAGASSIAELSAWQIPTILVPLRGVARDLQEKNARAMEKSGACAVLEQDDLDSHLVPMVKDFLSDPPRCEAMKTALDGVCYTEAAGQIAIIITECIAREA